MAFQLGKSGMTPQTNLEVIDLEKMCDGGIFREQAFRQAVQAIDWGKYSGKDVLVKGCGNIPIPTWAYMLAAVSAAQKAKSVSYGEAAKPISVFGQR